eukprot:22583_1
MGAFTLIKIFFAFGLDCWDVFTDVMLGLSLINGINCGSTSSTCAAIENTEGSGIALLVVSGIGFLISIVGKIMQCCHLKDEETVHVINDISDSCKLVIEDFSSTIISLIVAAKVGFVSTTWMLSYWTSVVMLAKPLLVHVVMYCMGKGNESPLHLGYIGCSFLLAIVFFLCGILSPNTNADLGYEILILNNDDCNGPWLVASMDRTFSGNGYSTGEEMYCSHPSSIMDGTDQDTIKCVITNYDKYEYVDAECSFSLDADTCTSVDSTNAWCTTQSFDLCYYRCTLS